MTENLEKKIRYYLGRFPNIEYSGTLFYSVEGSFKEKNLVVKAFDFFLQDIGTAGYTEFEQSPDLIGYMCDNPELLEENVYQGLMHSHYTMGAFFSGTDIATLSEEGNDRVHFLSLIIDTKGTYQACITRKVTRKFTCTGTSKCLTFNGVESEEEYSEVIDKSVIEYYELKVTRPVLADENQELASRIEEIYKQKAAVRSTEPNDYPLWNNNYTPYTGFSVQESTKVESKVEKEPIVEPIADIDYNVKVDDSVIEWLTAQLLTGSVAYTGAVKLQDMASVVDKRYDKRFYNLELFKAWANSYVEFIVYYNDAEEIVTKDANTIDDDSLAAIVAYNIKCKLEDLREAKTSAYISTFINLLDTYIM